MWTCLRKMADSDQEEIQDLKDQVADLQIRLSWYREEFAEMAEKYGALRHWVRRHTGQDPENPRRGLTG